MSTPDRSPLSPGVDLVRRGVAELLRALAAMIDPPSSSGKSKALVKKNPESE